MKSGTDVLSAVLPLLKFLSLSIFGLILSHPRIGLVPKATLKVLSKLVFVLFLPCLIFTNLGPTISLQNLIQWWFIPVNVLLSTATGCVLGLLVAVICRPPPQYFRFTIIMTGFGNTGNLPLAVVASICHSKDNPFGPACHSSGVAYVSFSQWIAVFLVYTLVYHMMEPPLEYYEIVEEGTEIDEIVETEETTVNDLSRPLLIEAEWPGMEDRETEHCKTPLIARLFTNNISGETEATVSEFDVEGKVPESPKSIRCLAEPRIVRRIRIVAERTPISHILQPPTIASLLAIFIGMFPTVKAIVFDKSSLFSILTDSFDILAEAMVPSVMLVLGGMLAEGPNKSDLGIRTTIGIVVARLLVLPLLGIGIVSLADRLNFLIPSDQLYRFVLLLQYTTPSAILLGAIASLRAYAVKEASAVIFWQHVFAVLSFSLYVIVYFKMLLSYA
ncbi:Auxin efflux carrier [Parasponia andersonii]|uniref:Auxin efflux carrier n=1 Tax=Parasponia andersonii TaxID=3476 RepID=A0A2P5DVZ4_PARAD|nr:Auxin efflux carrier [Parasponia andersonii]